MNHLKHGFFIAGKMSRESPVEHLNDRSNQMIDSLPTQKWFLPRSIGSCSLPSNFFQFHHNRCTPRPQQAAFAVIMTNSKFCCSTIFRLLMKTAKQLMLCRASASSGEVLIARKNNYMSPILNLPQESCTFYSFRDTVIIKGVDNHCQLLHIASQCPPPRDGIKKQSKAENQIKCQLFSIFLVLVEIGGEY